MLPNTNSKNRSHYIVWQLLFVLLATTWLWAPILNTGLSAHLSLISQYESPSQPYAWLFRLSDVLSSVLLLLMAVICLRKPHKKFVGWLLLFASLGSFADPLFTTTCRVNGLVCQEYFSVNFVIHAATSIVTSFSVFIVSVYDSRLRKKLVSILFVIFQLAYAVLFVSQLATHAHFNTLSQYFYQTLLVVWIAWFCRDYLGDTPNDARKNERSAAKVLIAVWAFINGIAAIVLSLAHIHLLGKIKGIYFAGDSAWLAQHGVIIGVVMLYLSRHLARGEMRARQIFLIITGFETIKYAVISPNALLLPFYLATFCILFVVHEDFNRGNTQLTWSVRLKDLYFMLIALGIAVLAAFLVLDSDSRISAVAGRTFTHFFDYAVRSNPLGMSHGRSALLAHTASAFILVSFAAILWILFKPSRTDDLYDPGHLKVKQLLHAHADYPEDYFKYWPLDKEYFWQRDHTGFIAYKRVGAIAFALADPVSADKSELLQEFLSWSKSHRLKVCFLPVYDKNLALYEGADLSSLQIGSSAIINVQEFITEASNDKWWRWQKNRAKKQGYEYSMALPPHSIEFLGQLRIVSDAWLGSDHQERGFALGYYSDEYMQQCVIHYLTREGKVAAFANQVPEFKPYDTVTVDLMRYETDANNSIPYLLYKTIDAIAASDSGYKYFDLGFVPFAKADSPLLKIARTLSGGRFSSQGLEQFKNKFEPSWQPNYLAYDGDLADLALIAINLEKVMTLKP